MTKPNFIDRVVSYFSPAAGSERANARQRLASIEGARRYDAVSRAGRFTGWRADRSTADAEITAAGPVLRARSRDMVRNNPIAAKAVQTLTDSLVGTGIRPRAATGDAVVDAKIDALFEEWSKQCDIDGRTDFYGLQTLAARGMIEGGEMFAIRRRTRLRRSVPVQIELREPEHMDDTKIGDRGKRIISQGIEYDDQGHRAAYWMFPYHPDAQKVAQDRLESVRFPADQVAHLYERQRVQSRGVPWAAPVMRAIKEIDEWQEAELVRKRTEACMVAVVTGDDDAEMGVNPGLVDGDGMAVEQFRPGMIAYGRGGKDIHFNNPGAAGGVYEWHKVQMHIIASGYRMPYELLTGDLSQVNFSSSRVGLNAYRRMIEAMQWQVVIPTFCQPIWDWFIEAAFAAGKIGQSNVEVEWSPPRFESVNPLQDAQADLLEVRAGFATLPQVIAKRGYDPRASLQEQADCLKEVDILGLVLDSDPRRVAKAGTAQNVQPGDGNNNP